MRKVGRLAPSEDLWCLNLAARQPGTVGSIESAIQARTIKHNKLML